MRPDPPNRRTPLSVQEIGADPERPHTPVPAAPTVPPPAAMPMKPPRGYEGPRPRLQTGRGQLAPKTLTGMPAPPSEPPPMRDKLDSREVSTDTLLAELARQANEARAAKAEAEALRRALEAAERAPHAADSLAPGSERKALLRLAYKLGTPLVLLMGAATAWLGAHTAKVEERVDRVEEHRAQDKVVTDPLPAKVQTTERAAVDCREWAAAWDDYNRQVLGKLGVSIPPQPNSKPVTPIETRAPRHKANAVTGAPTLEVLTPPPALP